MGTVSNVGLMAQAAEEYGSHDKTFEIAKPARCACSIASGQVLIEHRSSRATSGACAARAICRFATG
jgi:isocitrate dehydrogenase